ncbi:MAG: hypothetical protein JRD68_06590 [Deltaproteobacteria bacterium]|nr:hypothetical protein [Deltaproteobacteria bacterium]
MKENPVRLTAALDRESAGVGDIVRLTLEYRLPEGAKLTSKGVTGLEDLTVVERKIESGRIRIALMIDRTDTWETGRLSLTYQDKDGREQTLLAKPVTLTVLSNLGDNPEEARLKPIQGIILAKTAWLRFAPWTGVGLAIVLLGLLLFGLYRRKRAAVSAAASDPPHIAARKELEGLEALSLFENGRFKEYYFQFSYILRRYLENLRGFPAPEFTTQEIARALVEERDRDLLRLLQDADMVKFADSIPSPAARKRDVKTALDYIRETGPREDDLTAGGRREEGP